VEDGNFFGFAFIHRDVSISDLESARHFVTRGIETPTVQNLINSYLLNPRGTEVVSLA